MSYNLFLDDIRMPVDVGNYMNPVELRQYFRKYDWIICRNYNEFVECINKRGLPEMVSFDHDLADEHYTPEEYWHDYDASKEYQDKRRYKEKTGYDCAKWMIDYSKRLNACLPSLIMCHSMNPVGKDRIVELFKRL